MATHDDGTMDVLVDGEIQRRRYTRMYMGQTMTRSGLIPDLPTDEPEHASDEVVIRTIGEVIPRIVKI